jgi:hypothetical protein
MAKRIIAGVTAATIVFGLCALLLTGCKEEDPTENLPTPPSKEDVEDAMKDMPTPGSE